MAEYLEGFADPDNYEFEPRYMKIQQLRDPDAAGLQWTKRILTRLGYFVELLFRRKRIALRRRGKLTRAMNRVVSPVIPDNYVYFPLHYEPERTTNPDGGIYHDQMRTLARLRAFIPANMQILVKEHPSVFTGKMKGHLGRSPALYDMIRKIEGVLVVELTKSTADLILGAKFVASVSGTVALEAAILERPALIFGSAWFEGCPGIQKFSQQMNFEKFLLSPLASRTDIRDWMNTELVKRGMPGCVNPSNERYFEKYYKKTDLHRLELDTALSAVIRAVSSI